MRWDRDYKKPEIINDPVIIPAYGVTDEERARWNAKQDALVYDPVPTQYSDHLMISGAIYNALENYKIITTEACKAYFNGAVHGLVETQQIVIDAAERAETAAISASTSAEVSESNKNSTDRDARDAADSAYNAANSANDAFYSAEGAEANRLDAEAWAVGTRDGEPVDSEDPTYHHNAKYYADLGREVIDDTETSLEYTWSSSKLSTLLSGKADLENGKVPASQLPSYVDDVEEYSSTSAFPAEGESGKIYIATDTNKQYRWTGSAYAIISESLALGETSSTAYAGNKGKQNADNISALQGLVTGIQDVIPSTATSSNKLATAADIPTTLAGLSDDATHRTVTDAEKSGWDSKAPGTHTHDDRYYTESEVDTALQGKSDTSHTHDDRYYTETETDTLLQGKAAASHTHDDRYYTETETDTLLQGKADSVHTHDDRYYTETEIDNKFNGVTFTTSDNEIYINW